MQKAVISARYQDRYQALYDRQFTRVEDWEEDARKKNDCVEEARLLTKYKGLVFNDPDSGSTFSVWDRNMEFRRGRGNGWFVVGVSADKPDDESCNEPFSLDK